MPADGGAPAEVRQIPRALLDPDPHQPRRGSPDETFDVSDLVGSIRANGVTVPLLVEPRGGRYSIIDGERRYTATGPEHVDLAELPCIVRDDITPDERIAIQLATYATQPLPPLREAAALARLQAELGSSNYGDVAERIGKSTKYVEQRIALLTLAAPVREALAAGLITLGLIFGRGRLPGLVALAPVAQARAFDRVNLPEPGGEPAGITANAWCIAQEMMLLAEAPFPVDDAALPGGACGRCPKRTRAQLDLLDATETDDRCTDRVCWGKKIETHDKRKLPEAPPSETEREPEERDETEGGEPESEPPPARERGLPLPAAKPKGSAADDVKVERQAEEAARERALAKICSAMAKRKPDENFWRLLASLVIRDACATWPGLALAALGRRGISGGPSDEQATRRLLDQMRNASEGECRGLIVELLAAADETGNEDDVFTLACRAAKVDHPALLAEELEKARAAVKPVERPRGKAAHPPPQPPEGAKGVPPCTCKPGRGPHAGKCPVLLARKAPPEPVAKGEPSACPLTEAHVAALLVELRITDAHPGAVSPANVWASARGLLTLVTDLHPAEVARTNVLSRKGFADAGEHAVDCAAAFLAKGEVVRTIAAGRGGWRLTLSAAVAANLEDDALVPLPDPVKVFNPPRRCAVCGCTDSAACTDGAGECTWERRGTDDVCSVCARACKAALTICQTAQVRSALEKALSSAKGKGIETFDKSRAKATIAYLERAEDIAPRVDGKFLDAQPLP